VDFLPLNRHLREQSRHAAHADVVRRLIHARRAHPALRSDAIAFDPTPLTADKLMRFWRWEGNANGDGSSEGTGGSDAAAVALNFAATARTVELHLPYGGRWRDIVSNRVVEVESGPIYPTLAPYGACLFVPDGA
jgi:hypothetical protein